METYKLEDLKQISKDQKYRHVRLTDMDGNVIVAWNPASMSVEKRIDEMENRLSSPAMKDGYYKFECKMYLRASAKPDIYYVVKGTPEKVPDITPTPVPKKGKNALSYKEAIKMNKTIAELRAQLGTAETERDKWRAEYDSLYAETEEIMNAEPEEEEPGMSEGISGNAQTFITETLGNLTPLFDRHYDLKAKELEIKEGKVLAELARAGVTIPTNGESVPPEVEEVSEIVEEGRQELLQERMTPEEFNGWVTKKMAHLAETDPERYAEVAQIANGGGDIVDLLNGGDGFSADPGDEGEVEVEEE